MKCYPIHKPLAVLFMLTLHSIVASGQPQEPRPNILFCIADDWGWPHAGVYGDAVVKTPVFNSLAKEGVLFEAAFVSSPSCTPSRNAILTGQDFWRLGEGANLWSTLDSRLPVYPLLLEQTGYFIGSWRKSFGPGSLRAGGYVNKHPAGKVYPGGFEAFLNAKPADQPFCFWMGASDPHRPYEKGSGVASGMDLASIQVPAFYPNATEVRSDLADYYFEVQRFDSDIGKAIALLKQKGMLEHTIIVVTGDHGMPFPRCKGNLYDMGVRVPLVIRWGNHLQAGKKITELVSLTDLAPTFLEMAGAEVPAQMTGRSLRPLLTKGAGPYQTRDFIVYGRERHTAAQANPSLNGYPSRAIRSRDYLYIRNLFADRWPVGVPEGATHPIGSFADCDAGPTKTFLMEHRNQYALLYDLSFSKRPAEELYDLKNDPFQLVNIAAKPAFQSTREALADQLVRYLKNGNDPRFVYSSIDFDHYPFRR